MRIKDLKFDCKYFKGYMPCEPNKLHDVSCNDCSHYEDLPDWNNVVTDKKLRKNNIVLEESNFKRILFIKLGAIGDVIRTTPLITKYNNTYPNCHFTWLTLSPDVLPTNKIDKIYKWDKDSVKIIKNQQFDIALNLDKDKEACELLADVRAKEKFGFIWKDNHIDIATAKAEHKLITGLFDHISKKNTKNYMEEIFEICHFDFNKEEYMINLNNNLNEKWAKRLKVISKEKTIIALNTGCGERWKTRLWPKEYWIKLIKDLEKQGYFCLLMGGLQEDAMNTYYTQQTNATYFGYFSLEEFIAITNNSQIIVTPVSMIMHVALALRKQLMLFHNIFNIHEFELYDRGVIIEPTTSCDCYFGNTCSRERSCMYDISVQDVLSNIAKLNDNVNK